MVREIQYPDFIVLHFVVVKFYFPFALVRLLMYCFQLENDPFCLLYESGSKPLKYFPLPAGTGGCVSRGHCRDTARVKCSIKSSSVQLGKSLQCAWLSLAQRSCHISASSAPILCSTKSVATNSFPELSPLPNSFMAQCLWWDTPQIAFSDISETDFHQVPEGKFSANSTRHQSDFLAIQWAMDISSSMKSGAQPWH